MLLKDIIAALPGDIVLSGDAEREILGIAYDSRQVKEGYLFVAIPGLQVDGHDFIPQAVANGACAVIAERRLPLPVPLIVTADSRRALAFAAAAWYGYPDRQLRLIGVTGTNGKTTTTHLIKFLLEKAGRKSGVLGTVGAMAGDKMLPEQISAGTTPESLELFGLLSQMVEASCGYAVIEASSQALAMQRVSACNFAAGVFTNLTQDHLDYHGDMVSYCQSKETLFRMLAPERDNRYGVINLDDAYAERFCQACRARQWSYGMREGADLQLLHLNATISGMRFSFKFQDKVYTAQIPLIGKFNVYNALAAICVALAEGLEISDILSWLPQAPQVAGRFELVDEGQDFAVVVDYAHTPDGLENVLHAARALKPRRVICVFGCGGDRDSRKRPLMGRIAGQYADVAVLTSDNPRNEDPQTILEMVEEGIRSVGNNYLVEIDREKAIRLAIGMASSGDIVLLAGKGHEDYQIIRGVKHHFDDREIARNILRARLGKE